MTTPDDRQPPPGQPPTEQPPPYGPPAESAAGASPPPGGAAPPGAGPPGQPPEVMDYGRAIETDPQARQWGMLVHLAGLAGFVVPWFGNILGPLIVWLIKKDQFPFVDREGKEAINFQICISIYLAVAGLLIMVAIGCLLLPAVGIFALVMVIMAAVKANKGEAVRYPLTIRFLK